MAKFKNRRVLTTSSGQYVDIRILLPPNFSGDSKLLSGDKDTLKVDWAFAGTSKSSDTVVEGKTARECTWTHWIDSHKPSGYQDSGVMWTQEDATTIEVGKMENPTTGKEEGYEELWEDQEPELVGSEGEGVCYALKFDEGRSGGMIVRIGAWIQGLRIDQGEGRCKKVTVRRWYWLDGQWKLMVSAGDGELPSPLHMCKGGQYLDGSLAEWKTLE